MMLADKPSVDGAAAASPPASGGCASPRQTATAAVADAESGGAGLDDAGDDDGDAARPGLATLATRVLRAVLVPHGGPDSRAQAVFDKANCLTAPLAFVLVLVCAYAWALDLDPAGSAPFAPARFRPEEGDSVARRTAKGAAYAGIIVGAIIVLTYVFVGMLHFRMEKTVHALVLVTFAACLGGLPAFIVARASEWHEFPVDLIGLTVICWNLGTVGAVLILWDAAPRQLSRGSLLLASVALTWPFCSLPELTLWFLMLFMVLWDLFAVLTPCGPLRYALYLEQQRKYMAEEFRMPGGMVFEGRLYELGLMDLVFYGVIVGRGAMIDACTVAACFCAVVAGLLITIAVTPDNVTIPALPITLSVGVAVYFGSRYTLQAFCSTLSAGLLAV